MGIDEASRIRMPLSPFGPGSGMHGWKWRFQGKGFVSPGIEFSLSSSADLPEGFQAGSVRFSLRQGKKIVPEFVFKDAPGNGNVLKSTSFTGCQEM